MSSLTLSAKLDRSDGNTPWGFRMYGGMDFGAPLTIQRVAPGSLAQKCGLQEGDVITKIGESPASSMRHKEAQQKILMCGNSLEVELERGGRGGGRGQAGYAPVQAPQSAYQPSAPAPVSPGGYKGGQDYNRAAAPFSPGGGGPGGPNMSVPVAVNKQYNTPINMYSMDNVMESLVTQTSAISVTPTAGSGGGGGGGRGNDGDFSSVVHDSSDGNLHVKHNVLDDPSSSVREMPGTHRPTEVMHDNNDHDNNNEKGDNDYGEDDDDKNNNTDVFFTPQKQASFFRKAQQQQEAETEEAEAPSLEYMRNRGRRRPSQDFLDSRHLLPWQRYQDINKRYAPVKYVIPQKIESERPSTTNDDRSTSQVAQYPFDSVPNLQSPMSSSVSESSTVSSMTLNLSKSPSPVFSSASEPDPTISRPDDVDRLNRASAQQTITASIAHHIPTDDKKPLKYTFKEPSDFKESVEVERQFQRRSSHQVILGPGAEERLRVDGPIGYHKPKSIQRLKDIYESGPGEVAEKNVSPAHHGRRMSAPGPYIVKPPVANRNPETTQESGNDQNQVHAQSNCPASLYSNPNVDHLFTNIYSNTSNR